MTEGLILFGIGLSSIFLIDPFFGGALTASGAAKAAVLLFVLGPIVLHFLGRALANGRQWQSSSSAALRDWWPVLLLGTFIFVGSSVARFGKGIEETFLSFGIGMAFAPIMGLAIDVSAHQKLFFKALAGLYIMTACLMYVVAAAGLHTLHEQIFIAVPLGIYFLIARPLTPWKLISGLLLTFGTLVTFKNTTFILIGFSIFIWFAVLVTRLARRKGQLEAVTTIYFSVVLFLAVVVSVAVLWASRPQHLPTGNTEYRIEMYGIAFRRFLHSPIWGTAFSEPSVTFFQLYQVAVGTNYLPTHSDVLDMLAHGGVIAIGLWLATVWRILKMAAAAFGAITSTSSVENETWWRWLFVLGILEIGAIITYSFNPPLSRLVNGLWIWGGAGVMWALHRRLTAQSFSGYAAVNTGRSHLAAARVRPLAGNWRLTRRI